MAQFQREDYTGIIGSEGVVNKDAETLLYEIREYFIHQGPYRGSVQITGPGLAGNSPSVLFEVKAKIRKGRALFQVIKVFILSFITAGLYLIWWFLKDDMTGGAVEIHHASVTPVQRTDGTSTVRIDVSLPEYGEELERYFARAYGSV